MAQNINVVAKVDTKEVKEGAKDFKELKEKVNELSKEIPGLGSGLEQLGSTIGSASNMVKNFAGVLGSLPAVAIAASVAFAGLGVAMAFKMADVIDGFGDLGEKLGLTADQAYFMSTAAKQAGGDLQSLMAMGQRLARAMANSGDEMKGAGAALARLGVNAKDSNGQLLATEEVAKQLIEKWENSAKTASDYADMQQLLGKNFEQQLPVLKAVIEADKLANEMHEKGIGISKASLEATADLEKQQLKLGAVFNSMGSTLVELVLPAFNGLISWFVRSYTEGGIVAKAFTAIVVVTEVLMIAIKGLATAFMVVVEAISLFGDVGISVFKAVWQAMKGDFEGAKETLLAGFGQIGDRVKALAGDIKKEWAGTIDNSAIAKLLNGESIINRNKNELQTPKPNTVFKGGPGGNTRPDKDERDTSQDAITRLIESLNKQAMAQENLNKVELIGKELQQAKYKDATAANRIEALRLAGLIDEANAQKILNAAQQANKKIADDYVGNIQDEIRARTMNTSELRQEQALRKLDNEILRETNELQKAGLLTQERKAALDSQRKEATKAIMDATMKAKKADDDWFNNGINGYIKQVGTLNENLAGLAMKGFGQLSDGLTELATGGEFSFKSFAASIVNELARMAIQFLVIIPIIKEFQVAMRAGSAGGGFLGAIGSMFGAAAHGAVFPEQHADGAVAGPGIQSGFFNGKPVNYNEAGDEAILPLKRTAGGDLGVVVAGGSGGGNNTQINNITINGDSSSDPNAQAQQARMISQMLDRKWDERFATATRPGGVANRVSMTV